MLTKEAHHKRPPVGFVAAAFKRCASFASTSHGAERDFFESIKFKPDAEIDEKNGFRTGIILPAFRIVYGDIRSGRLKGSTGCSRGFGNGWRMHPVYGRDVDSGASWRVLEKSTT